MLCHFFLTGRMSFDCRVWTYHVPIFTRPRTGKARYFFPTKYEPSVNTIPTPLVWHYPCLEEDEALFNSVLIQVLPMPHRNLYVFESDDRVAP